MLDNIIWKVKQFFRKSVPILLVGGALFGGYKLYKRGYLHRYMPTSVSHMLYKIPYFGSRFSHYQSSTGSYFSKSYAHKSRHSKRSHGKRRHRRHRRF